MKLSDFFDSVEAHPELAGEGLDINQKKRHLDVL